MPVCLCCVEASVRACGEKQPAPALHGCSPQPLPSPPLPHSPRRWGGGGEGSELRRYECSHSCSGLSCCVSRQNVGQGGGQSMRVWGGVKGKRKRLLASRGSLDPVIFVFIIHFFVALFLFSSQTTAAEPQDGVTAFLALCTKKIKGVVFIPEPDF